MPGTPQISGRSQAEAPEDRGELIADTVRITWDDVSKRIVFIESQVFPQGGRVYVAGVEPVGSVIAFGLALDSERFFLANTPDEANCLIHGFACAAAEKWEELFPDKTVVCAFDKADPEFAGKWLVMPWDVHYDIQEPEGGP